MWRVTARGAATLCPCAAACSSPRRRDRPRRVVVIGLSQAEESSAPQTPERRTLDPALVRARLAGAPAPLARLHRNANGFLPGEDERLKRSSSGCAATPSS